MKTSSLIPKDLQNTIDLVFQKANFQHTNPVAEVEGIEYSAFQFKVNEKNVLYREAKITPTKTGQFVTLWKRNSKGIIAPFEFFDEIDLVIISTRSDTYFGQFVFPKSVLLEKGVFSTKTKEGKRAIRVYPPWDVTTSKQAKITQQWQLNFFLEISLDESINLQRVNQFYQNGL